MDELPPANDPMAAVPNNLKRNVHKIAESPVAEGNQPEAKRIKEITPSISADQDPPVSSSLKEQRESERLAEKQRKQEEREQEKQRKLAERQAKKEAKDREREAERIRKEQEKQKLKEQKEAQKEAEKREKEAQKEAEKREKEAQKEAEKREKEAQKEAEKREKEAEKLRAQPSISKFFKTSQTPVNKPAIEAEDESKLCQTDYEQHILPYQPRRDGIMFDVVCNTSVQDNEPEMDPQLWLKSHSQRPVPNSTKLSCQEFQTKLALAHESSQITSLLAQLRIRRIQFSHLNPKYGIEPSSIVPINIEHRPPYIGTTHDLVGAGEQALPHNPFRTDLDSQLNYEYDSEVEWDGNDDGEDLEEDDMDDSDEEAEDSDELQAFLTADDDTNTKRHKLVGPLIPTVLWGDSADLQPFAMLLLQNLTIIDPLFVPTKPAEVPPPQMLDIPTTNTASTFLASISAKIPRQDLHDALLPHNNSASTKTLIVELLKQKFPQALAAEIRQLFDTCFERIGKKRSEKKWVFTETAHQFFEISSIDI